MRSFGSDNHSGVHPEIMKALSEANNNHLIAYGGDPYTEKATRIIIDAVGVEGIEPLFTFNGTGANVAALQTCVQSFHSIICARTAHIAVDECGAPTKMTGCMLKEIDTPDGKLTPEQVLPELHDFGFEHHAQPKVIAVSQTTELGTLYTPHELRALADLAHQYDMYLFVDGTRIANACASLGCSLREITVDCGVDIFTLGGTKNGLMFGEAIVPLRPELSKNLRYFRKQTTQLCSKMRYISSQFIPYLEENIWLDNARHSNASAQHLAEEMQKLGIKLTQNVQGNEIFFILEKSKVERLLQRYFFYPWDEAKDEMRLVCSWDTTEEDVKEFVNYLKTIL